MGKFCRYCVEGLPIDNFEDGLKKCLEYKRKNYDKHKDTVNETGRTKYKEHEECRKEEAGTRNKTIVIKLPLLMYVIHQ